MAAVMGIMTACGAQGNGDASEAVDRLVDEAGQASAEGAGNEGPGDGKSAQDGEGAGEGASGNAQNSGDTAQGDGSTQDGGTAEGDDTDQGDGSAQSGDKAQSGSTDQQAQDAENALPDYLRGIDLTGPELIEHTFSEVTVHDPSVIKADGTWYIFGSHLAGAKTDDLMNWTLIDSDVKPDNAIIPNAKEEMKEAFEWAKTDTFWAPDVIQLADGRFYMYYCNCEGASPLSALGIAVADHVEGPYQDLGIILRSGQDAATLDEDGGVYDATIEPNAVDPCVFYDKEGRLWMVYGSYSGGIYILELNPDTGFPLESGYGKKLLGGNHLRIEAPYILYSPETEYYYLFLSFGGLAADGGYNIRVCRSENPDGPYVDSEGQDMIACKGPVGSFFDDSTAGKYGVKLMGNFSFPYVEGENGKFRSGYVSPGHNSAIYEEETGQYFLIFHTRFEGKGEAHQVRVHQMFLNEDGWPVVSPYRYAGERLEDLDESVIPGPYKVFNHMHNISSVTRTSEDIVLNPDHTVGGSYEGTWELKDGHEAVIVLNGIEYRGEWIVEWDQYGYKDVVTFTALSDKGYAVWGSGYTAQ